jgi:nucleoid DNA-binding protein
MKKRDLAQKLSDETGCDPASAADKLDRAVNELVKALRSGKAARLPGLGTITPGKRWTFRRERQS